MTRPRMPANMAPFAEEAVRKHSSRSLPPKVEMAGSEFAPVLLSPYAEEDQEPWLALLLQAFGTRSASVATCFLEQLSSFCRRDWDSDANEWRPSQEEFDAVLAIVSSTKPRNEAQAAFAAQLAALHLAAMRLARRVTGDALGDDRTVAVLTKTVRAYGDGLATMQRLQGKSRSTRQTIKVESQRHQHIHYHGGSEDFGGQAQATRAEVSASSRSVQGPRTVGPALSLASGTGETSLPDSRRRKGIGSTHG